MMSSDGEKKAFRRLKRIEWKLAYIENEQRWIERSIRWTNNPKVVVLTSAVYSLMFYLYFAGMSYARTGTYSLDMPCLTYVIIAFLILSVALWAYREKTDMNLTSAKRRMEHEAVELENEREEIYSRYPDLRGRPVKGRLLWFRRYVIPLLVVLVGVLVVIAFSPSIYNSSPDRALIAFLTYVDYFLLIFLLPRLLGHNYNGYKFRRKRAEIPVEKEEHFDILQYKRF